MSNRSLLLSAVSCCLLIAGAAAQCEPQWQPGEPFAHPNGGVNLAWDPDGSGPEPLWLLGSSQFGGVAFDGTRWRSFGPAPHDVVGMGIFNGQLVGVSPRGVATWNGTSWQDIGAVAGSVAVMAVYQGALFVAGTFTAVGGVPAANIARWDGSSWSALGSGIAGTSVAALAVFSNVLNVGGVFTHAGGVAAGNFAAWNGSAWIARPACDGMITALAVRNGTTSVNSWLFVAGHFQHVGTVAANRVARFNESTNTWSPMGSGLPSTARKLCVRSTGLNSFEVCAGVLAFGAVQYLFWRWDGSNWSQLGGLQSSLGDVTSLMVWNGQYVASLSTSSGPLRFDGTGWQRLTGQGIDGVVRAVDATPVEVIIGGTFRSISGVAMNGIARRAGGTWSSPGAGCNGNVFALARLPNGDLIAGGDFTTAGGIAANRIARWDGTTWSPLGVGMSGPVCALLVQPDGSLLAAGSFTLAGSVFANRVARWNGISWSPLGAGVGAGTDTCYALARMQNGDLIAGGDFLGAGGVVAWRIARWNGSAWSALGSGLDGSVFSLAVMQNGHLLAGGSFTIAGGILSPYLARWDGTAWNVLPAANALNQRVASLTVLPDGDVVAGSDASAFSIARPLGGSDTTALARWNGSWWESLALHGSSVVALAQTSAGALFAGGNFMRAGGFDSGNFAHLAPTCPALAAAYGSAGPLSLAVRDLPWLGATYRGTTTGIAPNALVFDLLGFTAAATPLPLLHPAGNPACSLLVNAVATTLVPVTAGAATSVLRLPPNPVYLGAVLRNQTLAIELGPAGIAAIHASNGLRLTVGAL